MQLMKITILPSLVTGDRSPYPTNEGQHTSSESNADNPDGAFEVGPFRIDAHFFRDHDFGDVDGVGEHEDVQNQEDEKVRDGVVFQFALHDEQPVAVRIVHRAHSKRAIRVVLRNAQEIVRDEVQLIQLDYMRHHFPLYVKSCLRLVDLRKFAENWIREDQNENCMEDVIP